MDNKQKYLLIGAVLIGGDFLWKSAGSTGTGTDTGTPGTDSGATGLSADAQQKLAALDAWLTGMPNGNLIRAGLSKEGAQAITNVYNLATNVWNNPTAGYPFTVGINLMPTADRSLSIGAWWENFKVRNNIP